MAKSPSASEMMEDLASIISREIRVIKYKAEELEQNQMEAGNESALTAENLSKDELTKLTLLSRMLLDLQKEERERTKLDDLSKYTAEELEELEAVASKTLKGKKNEPASPAKNKK